MPARPKATPLRCALLCHALSVRVSGVGISNTGLLAPMLAGDLARNSGAERAHTLPSLLPVWCRVPRLPAPRSRTSPPPPARTCARCAAWRVYSNPAGPVLVVSLTCCAKIAFTLAPSHHKDTASGPLLRQQPVPCCRRLTLTTTPTSLQPSAHGQPLLRQVNTHGHAVGAEVSYVCPTALHQAAHILLCCHRCTSAGFTHLRHSAPRPEPGLLLHCKPHLSTDRELHALSDQNILLSVQTAGVRFSCVQTLGISSPPDDGAQGAAWDLPLATTKPCHCSCQPV